MTTVQIPSSLSEATERLVAIDAVATAVGWERAAIVAAFVRLSTHGGDRTSKATSSLAPSEFAALGIVGLRSKDTVRRYVQAWLDAHDGKHPPIGRQVKLPSTPWPPEDANKGSRTTTSNIGEQIRTNPSLAEAAAEALADPTVDLPPQVATDLYHGARDRALGGDRDFNPQPLPKPTPGPRFTDDDARRTIQTAVAQVQAAEAGEWEPSAYTRLMWSLFGRMLGGTSVDWDADLAQLVDSEERA